MNRTCMARGLAFGLALGLSVATAAHGDTVSGRMRRNPKLPAGADMDGRVLLFTPKPVQPGSSVSHWDTGASPNLLMEPSISGDLRAFDVDLTKQAMQDMGWPLGAFNGQVSYSDAANEGFNDPTLGAARKTALEMAVGAWGLILGSSVNVNVEAGFGEKKCDEDGATLASAGPRFVFMDFFGGDPGTWYSGPLAESLAGDNLSTEDDSNPNAADLSITFNSEIDNECLREGSRYYYGLDNNVPAGEISFVTVAMHELGHGLGFVSLVDETSGANFRGFPDIFAAMTYDTKTEKHWDEMTKAQRKTSAKRTRKVSFDGARTTARAKRYLKGRVVLEVNEPKKLAGNYEVGEASFGPKLKKKGIRGDLALVDDGSARPTFGCLPLVNGGEIAGKIAVFDRGECLFTEKVKNAQNAGAKGVVIVHNEAGPPPGLGGADGTIRIPAVRVGKRDGKKIKRALRRK